MSFSSLDNIVHICRYGKIVHYCVLGLNCVYQSDSLMVTIVQVPADTDTQSREFWKQCGDGLLSIIEFGLCRGNQSCVSTVDSRIKVEVSSEK